MNNPKVIITHTAASGKQHTAQDVDKWHKDRWPGFKSAHFKNDKGHYYHVGYHYVIEWDGKIVQCRDHSEEGAHAVGMNKSSIGVCFMGNGDNHLPSKKQQDAWLRLHRKISKFFPGLPTEPHRKYSPKTCHGKMLSDTYFADMIEPNSDQIQKLQQKVIYLMNILLTLLKEQ